MGRALSGFPAVSAAEALPLVRPAVLLTDL